MLLRVDVDAATQSSRRAAQGSTARDCEDNKHSSRQRVTRGAHRITRGSRATRQWRSRGIRLGQGATGSVSLNVAEGSSRQKDAPEARSALTFLVAFVKPMLRSCSSSFCSTEQLGRQRDVLDY